MFGAACFGAGYLTSQSMQSCGAVVETRMALGISPPETWRLALRPGPELKGLELGPELEKLILQPLVTGDTGSKQ